MTTHKLQRRRDAAQKTLNKFAKGEFNFAEGRDCAKMTLYHIRALGLKRTFPSAQVPKYDSAIGAARALREAYGVKTLPELLDTKFKRIAPAEALVGDIVQIEGEGELGALTISLGNGLVIAYHEDTPGVVIARTIETLAAWRTLPL